MTAYDIVYKNIKYIYKIYSREMFAVANAH